MKQQQSLFSELEGTPLMSSSEKAYQKAGEVVGEIKKVIKQAQAFDPFAPRPIRNGDFYIIYGNVPSKSNCYRIITFKPKKDAPPKIVTCDDCDGTGVIPRAKYEGADPCTTCNGTGEIEKEPYSHASLAKTPELKKYEKEFLAQWDLFRQSEHWHIVETDFTFMMNVYYPSRRSDLDNSLKVVLDCLQTAKAIKNDNHCVDIHVKKFVDKENPRIEFKIMLIL